MALLRRGTIAISRIVYVDITTGDITEANETIESVQSTSYYTDNWQLTDPIAGAYRGVVLGFISAQPTSPADGDRYVVYDSAIGTFQAFEKKIVSYNATTQAWTAENAPSNGTLVYDIQHKAYAKFNSDDFATGEWLTAVNGSSSGGASASGGVIYQNSSHFLDQSYLQYNVDFGVNKLTSEAVFTSADPSTVMITKGYVDSSVAALLPAPSYSCDSTVTGACQLVSFVSASNRTLKQLDPATADQAVGITQSAPVSGHVPVAPNGSQLFFPATATGAVTVGQRLFLKVDGSGLFTPSMPLTAGKRVWQVGVVASSLTTKNAVSGYQVVVAVKFIRVNG